MAIAKMQKLSLCGYGKDRKQLLKTFQKFNTVEITETVVQDDLRQVTCAEERDALALQKAQYQFCIDFLHTQRKIVEQAIKNHGLEKVKSNMVTPKPEIKFSDLWDAVSECELYTNDSMERLNVLNNRLVAIRTEQVKAENLIEQIKPFLALSVPFSVFTDTKYTCSVVGSLNIANLAEADTVLSAFSGVSYETYVEKHSTQAVVSFVVLHEQREAVLEKLAPFGFAISSFTYDKTVKDIISEQKKILSDLETEKLQIAQSACDEWEYLKGFELLHDFTYFELQKAEAEGKMKGTSKTFCLEAWVPEHAMLELTKALEESHMNLVFEFREPLEDELPPTLCVNNGFTDPYEYVTDMYSSPLYGERDPNGIMSIWYCVLFGMMLSDAVYGLILSIGTGIVLAMRKSKRGEDRLLKVIFMGGISTIFWGIMFGTYAGTEALPPVLLNPIKEPVGMIAIALVLGVLHIMTGIAMKMIMLFQRRKPVDAIMEGLPWYTIFAGLACFVFKMMYPDNDALATAAMVLSLVGIGLLFVSGIVLSKSKGAKKIGGGFGKLYGIINMFSDVLSYIRLFGLGLATGVIGMVFNQLGGVFIELIPYFGYVLAAIIIIIGHTFNLAINTLGAYVHNARLQYIEFYGKFYTGGGELFKPLGVGAKYYRVTN